MIFVDTSAWYALEDEDEINHIKAREVLAEIATGKYGIIITTDYVLDETMTLLRSKKGLSVAVAFIDKIRKSKSIRVFWVSESIFDKALVMFRKAVDWQPSFTDCTSVALMKDLGITEAFTLDDHFRQAGFNKLP
jgi:uncharacterized protein